MQLKVKAKQFANDNAKAGKISTLRFRRLKFYDMAFGLLIALTLSFGVMDKSYAGGSGTDPVSFMPSQDAIMLIRGGSGTDAKLRSECLSPADVRLMEQTDDGGGGHDPTEGGPGRIQIIDPNGGGGYDMGTDECKLKTLVKFVKQCRGLSNQFCTDVRTQSIQIWRSLKNRNQGWDI